MADKVSKLSLADLVTGGPRPSAAAPFNPFASGLAVEEPPDSAPNKATSPAFDPFAAGQAEPATSDKALALVAASEALPGPEGAMLRALLKTGGRKTDIAMEVVPAIAGAVIGSFIEPGGGTIVGGAGGAAAGNTIKQARQIMRGDRQDFGAGELTAATVMGAVPLGKLKQGATVLRTVGKMTAARGVQGAAIAGGGETIRQAADEPEMDWGRVAEVATFGGLVASVLGAGEGALTARKGFEVLGRHGSAEIPADKLPAAMRTAIEPPVASRPLPRPLPADAEFLYEQGGQRYYQVERTPQNPRGRTVDAQTLKAEGYDVSALPLEQIDAGPGVPPAAGAKPLGLVESAVNSPAVKPELKSQLSAFYEPITNAETIAEATRRIDAAGSLDLAKAELMRNQSPDALSNAVGLELLRRYQTENRLQDAADVLYDMASKAKTQGQAIQMLSTLSRSTPEGMSVYAQRLFGRKLTPDELNIVKSWMGRVTAAKDPEVKLARMAQLLDQLHRRANGSGPWDEKLTGTMNLSMLLNPKTIIRNIGGNVLMASADLAADVITPAVDMATSMFTGKRTVAGPQMVEYMKGLVQPIRDLKLGYRQARREGATRWASFKEGVDTMAILGKLVSTSKTEVGDITRAYRTTFSSPLMRSLDKSMAIVMGGPDRGFYTGRLRASLANQMKAAGVRVPTAEMVDQASIEAARAVYQDSNFISNALRATRGTLNEVSTIGRSSRFGAGQAILPFVQVPGALLMRGLEYSPAGFVKALAEAVGPLLPSKRPFNQREFSQAISKAFTGTAGLAATGYMLHQLGIITGGPDPDPKVRALQRAIGFGAYKVNVSALKRAFQGMDWRTKQERLRGDVQIAYDWAQPMAFPVALGADYSESGARATRQEQKGRGGDGAGRVLAAFLSGGRSIEEQPLLTGLTGFMTEAANASREGAGMLEALTNSMAKLPGQYVPTAVRQLQQLMDNRVYETRGTSPMESAYQAAAANVPKLAEVLGFKPRADLLGDMAERYQANGNSYFNVLVNPAFMSEVRADPELREMYRLFESIGATGQIPGRVDRTLSINGQRKSLTASETADYNQFVGRMARDVFRQIIRSPLYQVAEDDYRAKKMADALSEINAAAKVLLFGQKLDPRRLDSMVLVRVLQAQSNPATAKIVRER